MIKITENDQRVYVKESTIPGAGFGCFAKAPIKKGSFIEIIGVMVKRGSVADLCTAYANNYKFGSKDNDEIWHIIPMGYAALINHANSKETQNVEIRNVRAKVPNKKIKKLKGYLSYSGEAVYHFIKDVEKDDEILGNYGREWAAHWDWVEKYEKTYDDEWVKFIGYGLYNMPLLAEKVPLT